MLIYTSKTSGETLIAAGRLISASGAQIEMFDEFTSANKFKPNSILCVGDEDVQRLGGEDVFLHVAKSMQPAKIFLFNFDATEFKRENLLGGRYVKVTLPKISTNLEILASIAADLIMEDSYVYTCGSATTARTIELAKRVASKDVTVLINGPTGTGKEVLSKFVHVNSSRSSGNFVAINCAAIPENMLEAMLFGHEKGAFTGASAANQGIFRAANGGTLLLDEISEMPLSLQAKILRVLQERVITPLGGSREFEVDVRVIATTNRNMHHEVSSGNFREDLYYRLNVFPIETQSLKDRPEDIIPIAMRLLRKHSGSLDHHYFLSDLAAGLLKNYDWPGNVRELENVIQRALVLTDAARIDESCILITPQITPASSPLTKNYVHSKVG